jgi:arylsulfatase
MKFVRQIPIASIYICIIVAATVPLQAQQIQTTGTPGSPGATTTISGKQLPAPDPKFGGVIKDDALQSKPWWAPRVVPPKQAPNILLIMRIRKRPQLMVSRFIICRAGRSRSSLFTMSVKPNS